jgi:glycosyltransferase involved in cell wall biosynthesis
MRVVALLTVRNEILYIERCLRHLGEQGVEVCLIDNGSTDGTLEVAEGHLGGVVTRIEHQAFTGEFDLSEQCRIQERLSVEIEADWFIHHDADEIREAPVMGETLSDGLRHAGEQGFNAVDFSEFVFFPSASAEGFEHTDYVETITDYYYFCPRPQRRINAWRKTAEAVTLRDSGGHRADFPSRSVSPEQFILRHYVALSADHLLQKYSSRRFPVTEISSGWHGWRSRFKASMIRRPLDSVMRHHTRGAAWDRSAPQKVHGFIVEE